jgi:hypothetical protein
MDADTDRYKMQGYAPNASRPWEPLEMKERNPSICRDGVISVVANVELFVNWTEC